MPSRKKRRAKPTPVPPIPRSHVDAHTLPGVNRWILLALAAATVLAYVPALAGPFVMDDERTIAASAAWDAPPGFPTAGRPVALATLAINYAVNRGLGVDQRPDPDGPDKAVGYRLFNVLLPLLTGAMLFGVLRRALRERAIPADWRALADPLAGIVCALWLVHPIQTEVVNYIVQRTEALASFFYLATLYASLRAWDCTRSGRRLGWYVAAIAACTLGMLSKEIVITAPLMVMLYDRAFRLPSWRALLRPGNGRGWLYVALWLCCIAMFAVFEAGARGETTGFDVRMPWYEYLYTQCWAIPRYLRLVLWPSGLSVDYGQRAIRGWRGVPGAILLAVLGGATIAAWTRVERYGWLAFLGSWFFIVLAPSSSFISVASEVGAERRVYLAVAAVLVLVVVAGEWLRRRAGALLPPRRAAAVVAALVVVLAITTGVRSHSYATSEALWRSAATAMPENPRALGNLGMALFKAPVPKMAEAESVFAGAMAMDSVCDFGCLQYAAVLTHDGKLAAAVPVLERGTRTHPRDLPMKRALGLTLIRLGDYDRAIPYLEPVAAQFPTMDHLVVLGVAYLSVGRLDDATATFKRVAYADNGSPEMQRLSARLQDGVHRADALADLQQFARQVSRNWM